MGKLGGANRLETVQTAAAAVAVAALVLGFLASIGLRLVPALTEAAFWPLSALLALLGLGGGILTVVRGREIDRVRWELVESPLMTSGEREYAHKEAELQRRWAGTVFFAAPVALSYWAAYQLQAGTGQIASPLVALFPLSGYLVGLLGAHWRWRERPPR